MRRLTDAHYQGAADDASDDLSLYEIRNIGSDKCLEADKLIVTQVQQNTFWNANVGFGSKAGRISTVLKFWSEIARRSSGREATGRRKLRDNLGGELGSGVPDVIVQLYGEPTCVAKKSGPIYFFGAVFALGCPSQASAYCEVGEPFFAFTLTFDDPCVEDELSLPTIQSFKNGDRPSAQELDISGEYTKTITRNLGISIEEQWVHLQVPGDGTHSGFDNLGTSVKYQFVRDAAGQLAMSASLNVDWGGTGAKSIGAEPFTTFTPTWLAGKGFGFLPERLGLLRPLAITTELGYSFPTQSSTTEIEDGVLTRARNPNFLVWGGSVQYSLPYLKQKVSDLSLPDLMNHLVLLTEFNFQTQTSNLNGDERTTGTINPGLAYLSEKYQLTVEAVVPVNRASGADVGVIGNLHLFLEDILPHSLGKPLFGPASTENED